MKQQNTPPNTPPEKRSNFGRYLYMGYVTACMSVMLSQPASAATIWEKASEIMQDVYSQILANLIHRFCFFRMRYQCTYSDSAKSHPPSHIQCKNR